MDLVRNSRINVNMVEIFKKSLSFSSKHKEIVERTENIIDEHDPNKLLERGFEHIRKKDYIMKV